LTDFNPCDFNLAWIFSLQNVHMTISYERFE